jgi:serine/threonine protein kinase
MHVLENFHGIFKIDFDEIELKQKIGSGGFSDVYFAKWKGTIVAAHGERAFVKLRRIIVLKL